MSWYGSWRPYVPVAERRAKAAAYAARLAKKEKRALCPVKIEGRKIASSFWGQAWCDNLEAYSDFANRLPRGRTYARNGSVIDLEISRGKVKSIVSGSEIYRIEIEIAVLKKVLWNRLKRECSHSIDSLLDLLQGRFDQGVMQRLSRPKEGLFPQPAEIKIRCSCPDWATLCKHVAATLYGVGARLDSEPELLFVLRGVDHLELIREAAGKTNLEAALGDGAGAPLAGVDLGDVFGIDIELAVDSDAPGPTSRQAAEREEVVTRSRRTRAPAATARKTKGQAAMSNAHASRVRAKRKLPKKSPTKAEIAVALPADAPSVRRARTKHKTGAAAASTSSGKPRRMGEPAGKRAKSR